MKLAKITLCFFFLLGCASHNQGTFKDLKLSNYENIKWDDINIANAKEKIGAPDIVEEVGKTKSEIVWIYTGGRPPSSRLTLLFNKENGRLLNATWFFRSYDQNSDLKFLSSKNEFDLQNPKPNPDFFGVKKNYYTSKSKNMEMAVYSKDQFVEYISWVIR